MRVVFDTSVWVAAARSKRGASHALLSLLPHPGFQPAVSVPLFAEYRAVLMRPENLGSRAPSEVEGFLDFFVSTSHLQEIFFLWRPALRDPHDESVLELAVAAGCRYIITHNLKHFDNAWRWGVEALSPGDFLKKLNQQP